MRVSARGCICAAGLPGSPRPRIPAREAGGDAAILVAHASQTGFAEQLALQTAEVLRAAGMAVRLVPLGRLTLAELHRFSRALFVVSTTGEGDAPDSAVGFARRVMGSPASVATDWTTACWRWATAATATTARFGHALESWLHRHGARAMFDLVPVDDGDEGALRHWQHYLGVLSGSTEMADWSAPRYGRWQLVERRLLNAGSPGAPAFHIAMRCAEGEAQWQAGDIAEVGPRNGPAEIARCLADTDLACDAPVVLENAPLTLAQALAGLALPHDEEGRATLRGRAAQELVDALAPLPHREYSIASLPSDGRLELLVRQTRHADGRLGLGSGWLTEHAALGGDIALRVRINRSFHSPESDIPLILIGNGTGLAGLRAHLRGRAAAGRHRNWLLFGERTRAHDYFHGGEIDGWLQDGVLARLDLAFSREAGRADMCSTAWPPRPTELQAWVADGAAIYVCGSLQGMAGGVAARPGGHPGPRRTGTHGRGRALSEGCVLRPRGEGREVKAVR